jgi:hypothetical protein
VKGCSGLWSVPTGVNLTSLPSQGPASRHPPDLPSPERPPITHQVEVIVKSHDGWQRLLAGSLLAGHGAALATCTCVLQRGSRACDTACGRDCRKRLLRTGSRRPPCLPCGLRLRLPCTLWRRSRPCAVPMRHLMRRSPVGSLGPTVAAGGCAWPFHLVQRCSRGSRGNRGGLSNLC